MRQFLRQVWQLPAKNRVSLLIFEILYRIFFHETVTHTGKAAIEISLGYQGYSYLTEENFTEFISHPLTVVLAVLGCIMVIFLVLFEICALFACMEASWKKCRISVPEMLYAGLGGCFGMIRRKPAGWIPTVALVLPCLLLQAFYGLFTNYKLLQIIGIKLFQAFPDLKLPVGAAIVLLLFSVVYAVTFPFRLHLKEKGKRVLQRTKEALGENTGQRRRGLFAEAMRYFCIQAVIFLFLLFCYLLSHVLIVLYVMAAGQPQSMVSSVLAYADDAKAVLSGAAASLGVTGSICWLYLLAGRTFRSGGRAAGRKKGSVGIRRIFASRTAVAVLTLLLIAGEGVYLIYAAQKNLPDAAASSDYISVSAHRGGARKAPENTISALEYAIESKSDYAEIDVQETKDGEIVLMHDNNLKRTTGLNANVWTLTYEELCQLDAGARFHKSFRGEKIPTLKEAIETARGKIKLNIEVKYNGHNPNIIRKVVRIIEEEDFLDNCVLTSMNYKFLQQAKELNPDLRTGYTMNMTYGDLTDMDAADFFSVKYTYITSQFVEKVHALGKEVYSWTLNYQGDIQRMVNCKVDNIITDDPELVRKVILGETGRSTGFWELLKYALK